MTIRSWFIQVSKMAMALLLFLLLDFLIVFIVLSNMWSMTEFKNFLFLFSMGFFIVFMPLFCMLAYFVGRLTVREFFVRAGVVAILMMLMTLLTMMLRFELGVFGVVIREPLAWFVLAFLVATKSGKSNPVKLRNDRFVEFQTTPVTDEEMEHDAI